ncbi:MAG: T9SS type A sorting domain-containing protein [Flavobacteriales bacterium]|nr:T9SS type A sorting domain-containing protein [Flavobacteriales bacterium]
MKKLLFTYFLTLLVSSILAQGSCLTTEQTFLESERDVSFAAGLEELQVLSEDFEQGLLEDASRDGFKEVTIPVVVHVLYRLEENNISYDQILSQIEVLNRDFNWQQSDKDLIPEVWRDLGVAAKFKFKLADRDPDGNFTNGVTRTQTDVENIGTEELYYLAHRSGVEPWTQPFYMNIWVCELKGNSLGFAILPGAKMSERDGIVISPRAFGTMGTAKAPYNMGRTMVHEAGHYFGLRHIWGSDNEKCSSTDYIDDTPKQKAENYGCNNFPSISCNNGPNGDMFMNFMDYSNDVCALLFTKRQVEFMQLVLKTNRRAMFYSNGVTAVAESRPSEWKIYPNPSDGMVHLEFGDGMPRTIEIFNAMGEVVGQWVPRKDIERRDLSSLPKGMYYLRSERHHQPLIIR